MMGVEMRNDVTFLRNILLGVITLLIIILSVPMNIVICYSDDTMFVYNGNNPNKATVIEVDLSSIGSMIPVSNMVVTVLDGGREIEVPFIAKPVGIDSVPYIVNVFYKNRSVYKMDYSEYIKFVTKSLNNEIDKRLITAKVVNLTYLVRNSNSSRILVYLPYGIHYSRLEKYNGWYRRAIESNLMYRAVYSYRGYVLFVYYCKEPKQYIDRELFLPVDKPNSVINIRMFNEKLSLISEYMVDLREHVFAESYDKAVFLRIETYPLKKNNGIGIETSMYKQLWYARPWKSQHAGEGKIKMGNMQNRTLTGRTTYWLSDEFSIQHNTTRYELWIWLSTNKHVSGYLSVTLNNGNPIYWSISMDPGVLYGYSIVVNTQPEEAGNYLTPGQIKVDVYLGVNDASAKITFNSQVIAKAYIFCKDFHHSGFYIVRNELKGVGRLQEDGDQDPLDERYDMLIRGEAVFGFVSPGNFVPLAQYPYIYVTVESSPDQKYDRVVQLYINGQLLAEKVARNPNLPNGTRGKRSCTFYLYGNSITEEILSSMKMGVTPIIRVVIKGFQPPDENGVPREEWFVKGVISYYSRASCMSSYSVGGNILYMEDPTAKYATTVCSYIDYLVQKDYNGIQLWSGDSDVMEKYFQIIIDGAQENAYTSMIVGLEFNPTARWVGDQNSEGAGFTGYFHADLELHSPIEASVVAHTAYGPQDNMAKELLESIQWGLWVASLAASVLSFVSSNYIVSGIGILVTALSNPNLYVYGAIISSSWEYGSNHRILKTHITWNPGWEYYLVGQIVGRFSIKPTGGKWPVNGKFTLYYDYKAYIEFDNRFGTGDHSRNGVYYDHGYLVFYTIPYYPG